MKCLSYADFFSNFANKTRLNIIMALKEKPLSVTEIGNHIKEEQSKVSHNLKKLSACHIIIAEQKGKNRIYSLNKETVMPILQLIEEHIKNNCKKCDKHETKKHIP